MAGYANGGDSQRFTGMKDGDVVDELVRDVAMFFNKTKEFIQDKLVDHAIKRWGLDPHQLGGFAYLHAHEVLLKQITNASNRAKLEVTLSTKKILQILTALQAECSYGNDF